MWSRYSPSSIKLFRAAASLGPSLGAAGHPTPKEGIDEPTNSRIHAEPPCTSHQHPCRDGFAPALSSTGSRSASRFRAIRPDATPDPVRALGRPVGPRAGNGSEYSKRARSILQGSVRHLSRSEEHTSELQSLMRISYAVFCF